MDLKHKSASSVVEPAQKKHRNPKELAQTAVLAMSALTILILRILSQVTAMLAR